MPGSTEKALMQAWKGGGRQEAKVKRCREREEEGRRGEGREGKGREGNVTPTTY
jgi:hypothetical protein